MNFLMLGKSASSINWQKAMPFADGCGVVLTTDETECCVALAVVPAVFAGFFRLLLRGLMTSGCDFVSGMLKDLNLNLVPYKTL